MQQFNHLSSFSAFIWNATNYEIPTCWLKKLNAVYDIRIQIQTPMHSLRHPHCKTPAYCLRHPKTVSCNYISFWDIYILFEKPTYMLKHLRTFWDIHVVWDTCIVLHGTPLSCLWWGSTCGASWVQARHRNDSRGGGGIMSLWMAVATINFQWDSLLQCRAIGCASLRALSHRHVMRYEILPSYAGPSVTGRFIMSY
jgi:hypothetical protein